MEAGGLYLGVRGRNEERIRIETSFGTTWERRVILRLFGARSPRSSVRISGSRSDAEVHSFELVADPWFVRKQVGLWPYGRLETTPGKGVGVIRNQT